MSLIAAGAPSNLRSTFGQLVESDVFDICDRIKEIDTRLAIYVMPEASSKHFSIVELCADGVERFVFNTDELDARVPEKLRYLLHVPFHERLDAAERLEAKAEEDERARKLDEMYEQMGEPMWRDLEQCGFIQRPRSFAKRGISFAAQ